MKKFHVTVTEKLSMQVQVQASSESEATELVRKLYIDEKIVLTGNDFTGDLEITVDSNSKI